MSKEYTDDKKKAALQFSGLLIELFELFGCKNHLVFDVQTTLGLMSVTLQKASGQTPMQKITAAEDELARFKEKESYLQKLVQTTIKIESVVRGTGIAEQKLAEIERILEEGR